MRSIAATICFFIITFTSIMVFADTRLTFLDNASFSTSPTASGSFYIDGPFLYINLDTFTIRASDKYKHVRNITGYSIGLAKRSEKGWHIERFSNKCNHHFKLLPRETRLINEYHAVIPIDGIANLKDYWLVIAIELMTKGTRGYTYAHSQKKIF